MSTTSSICYNPILSLTICVNLLLLLLFTSCKVIIYKLLHIILFRLYAVASLNERLIMIVITVIIVDNKKLKDDEDKKVRKATEATRLKEHRAARLTLSNATGGSHNHSNEVTGNDGNGIFSDFKKAQTLKADEIINNKREQRLRGKIVSNK